MKSVREWLRSGARARLQQEHISPGHILYLCRNEVLKILSRMDMRRMHEANNKQGLQRIMYLRLGRHFSLSLSPSLSIHSVYLFTLHVCLQRTHFDSFFALANVGSFGREHTLPLVVNSMQNIISSYEDGKKTIQRTQIGTERWRKRQKNINIARYEHS